MKYAFVNGDRQEAQPKLRGVCPGCGSEVVARCGQRRVWHWSHLGKLECDYWREPETEWHRTWKGQFPKEWQEIPHVADDGERHIADVKTNTGLVIEFQHSPISVEERMSRENFYRPMVWVADGLRYTRDLNAFRRAITGSRIVKDNPLYLSPIASNAGIFQRWAPRQCPVFLDFRDAEFHIAGFPLHVPVLWQLLLSRDLGSIIIAAVTRESFLQSCLTDSGMQNIMVERTRMSPVRANSRQRRR